MVLGLVVPVQKVAEGSSELLLLNLDVLLLLIWLDDVLLLDIGLLIGGLLLLTIGVLLTGWWWLFEDKGGWLRGLC